MEGATPRSKLDRSLDGQLGRSPPCASDWMSGGNSGDTYRWALISLTPGPQYPDPRELLAAWCCYCWRRCIIPSSTVHSSRSGQLPNGR